MINLNIVYIQKEAFGLFVDIDKMTDYINISSIIR